MNTAILHARLVDGTGRAPIEDGALLIEDDALRQVGPIDEVVLPEDCRILEAPGKTVIPGIIDGHMHVTSMPANLDAQGHLRQNLLAVGKLQRCLEWGTTTVVNTGGSVENLILRRLLDEGRIKGCARLLVGGMVNATGGHVRGRSADGPWEVRKAVREMVSAGFDHIKTAASGGFMWEHESLGAEDYTLEELEALVDEAHRKGRRVHVHAHAHPGLRNAIRARCDVILHGALIDYEALEGMAAAGLSYMPTLYITSRRSYERPTIPSFMRRRMEEAHPVHRAGVRQAKEMGITLCVGTDGGPGDAMHELVELVGCGLSPMEAIVAGTRNTAQALDILDRLGTLEPGKKADLVLIDGNPLEDISILTHQESIALVMKGGQVEVTRGLSW